MVRITIGTMMKTYKDTNNNLWAYELDGSQDHLIPSDFIQITDEEAESIRLSQIYEPVIIPPTSQELMSQLLVIQEQIKALG